MKNAIILGLAIVAVIAGLVIYEDQNESVLEKGAETANEAATDVQNSVEGAANSLQQ